MNITQVKEAEIYISFPGSNYTASHAAGFYLYKIYFGKENQWEERSNQWLLGAGRRPRRWTAQGHRGTLWGDENVLSPLRRWSHNCFICQNPSNCVPKMDEFNFT